MFRLDLDRLRSVMTFDRTDGGGAAPTETRARVYVTPEGRVVIGDQVGEGESRMLSKVHPATFAAPPLHAPLPTPSVERGEAGRD